MKRVIKIQVKGTSHSVPSSIIEDPLESWFRKDGSIKEGISNLLYGQLLNIEKGGIMFITQEWQV